METTAFGSLLVLLMFSSACSTCLPSDFTLYVEKPECSFCVAINTTICMGYCRTMDQKQIKNTKKLRNFLTLSATY
uniref:Thyrotropin subunit beta n=1 Tax=Knipowitschia caucasica TaxID=637954 RepID=A0AAV2M752_KNICA